MYKKILFLFFALSLQFSFAQNENSSDATTIYLIRHAEKERTNPNDRDPSLTQDGLGRAVRWAEVLKNVPLAAVYSTDYKRTRQTASPSALKNQLELKLYDPRNFNISELKELYKGKSVLVVGHSNTTPFMANALLGKNVYKQIDDNNNGNLYIVTINPNNGETNSSLLYIN